LTVLEFCKKFNVPHQCVYDKIRRRPEVFEPYLVRDDKGNISDISPEIYDRLLPKDRIIEKLKSELAEVKNFANEENGTLAFNAKDVTLSVQSDDLSEEQTALNNNAVTVNDKNEEK